MAHKVRKEKGKGKGKGESRMRKWEGKAEAFPTGVSGAAMARKEGERELLNLSPDTQALNKYFMS